MNHREYCQVVEDGKAPDDPFCPLGSKFENEAGWIQNIIESCELNSVALIHSVAGAERSNHWHRHSDHFLYVVYGCVEYYERGLAEDGSTMKPRIYRAGEMFYTPPEKVHKTVFVEDTLLLSLGSNPRGHQEHENDLVREKF